MVDNVSHSDVHLSSLSANSSFGLDRDSNCDSPFFTYSSPHYWLSSEYSGIVNPLTPARLGMESLVSSGNSVEFMKRFPDSPMVGSSNNGGVSIKIIGSRENGGDGSFDEYVEAMRCHNEMDIAEDDEGEDRDLLLRSGDSSSSLNVEDAADGALVNDGGRNSHFQIYDLQLVGRWIEQKLPFMLILLVAFIRQHLRGVIVSLSMASLMFKSNNILRKQTDLKEKSGSLSQCLWCFCSTCLLCTGCIRTRAYYTRYSCYLQK